MKLAIAQIHASVLGNVASVQIVPGQTIDLDQVVGHAGGQPLTLEAALGDMAKACAPVRTSELTPVLRKSPAPARAPQPQSAPADDKE
jgi:hypothetical protein